MVKYYFYKLKFAICLLNYPDAKGFVLLTQYPTYIKIQFHLKNLSPGSYDCNMHEYGDESANYNNIGSHYVTLSNIVADNKKNCTYVHYCHNLLLNQIMGRSMIIYSKTDNTKKIACGIIGYRNNIIT